MRCVSHKGLINPLLSFSTFFRCRSFNFSPLQLGHKSSEQCYVVDAESTSGRLIYNRCNGVYTVSFSWLTAIYVQFELRMLFSGCELPNSAVCEHRFSIFANLQHRYVTLSHSWYSTFITGSTLSVETG